jgi:transcriptional regulator with XRE-family HTH domain
MVGFDIASCSHITDTIANGNVRLSVNDLVRELTYIPDVTEHPPHYLREWRKFRKLTQQELADRLDTSKSVISDMERGELQLSPKWARRIAPILNVSPGYLLDHDPEKLDTDIIDIWARIPERDRETAKRVLESFRGTGTKG